MSTIPKLSTPLQKGLAAGLLLLGGFAIVKLFTFIIAGGVLLLGILFGRQIWDGLLQFAQWSTRWLIANNPTYYLEKYFDYLTKDYAEFQEATQEVGADVLVSEQKVSDLIQQKDKATQLHARTNDPKVQEQYETQVYSLKEQIDFLMPVLEGSRSQYNIMKQIEEMREQDLKLFKIRMDATIQKFEILKTINSASNKAKKFLGTNSKQEKEYKEAAKQLERSTAKYIINIEDTNRRMLPELQKLQLNGQYNKEKGREIIEGYQKARLQLTEG
ncbi:MAG: hypothetical protein E6Q36_08285 [Chryseobacterium sp.]|nr:MAG: hypothetical protein E6Q36_08285 [Chryseobacterium sp.]